jgi:hypothetical protein
MKKKIIIVGALFSASISFGQWSTQGGLFNRWGNGSNGTLNSWRSYGFGNFSGAGATPQARVHINEFYLLSPWTGLNGNLFRTDGSENVSNNWSMYTGAAAATTTEKFRITSLANSDEMELGTVQNGKLNFITNNKTRITVLADEGSPYNRDGFVGFNNVDPLFHLDINTQNPLGSTWGELIFRGRIQDDPDAYISFVNIATVNTVFVPTLLGRQSDNTSSALTTIGSIRGNQDLAVNPIPITRFFSAINYDPSIDPPVLSLERANVVENRRLFGWYNGIDQLMTMESSGFLGVATTNPGNRVEINSDFYDATTGNPLGTAGSGPLVTATTNNGQPGLGGTNATGFSGLRFSDLKSTSNPYLTNPGPGVLAVDQNGDVIYVDATNIGGGGSGTVQGAHNGTSMSILDPTKVAFGNEMGATVGQLLSDREVPMNNNNIVFTDNSSSISSENNIGVGTANPDSKLHVNINNNVNANNTRGIRVENHANSVQSTGVEITIDGTNNATRGVKINIDGNSNPLSSNEGVRADLDGGTSTNSISGIANNASANNVGVIGVANSFSTIATTNTGVHADARAASGTNFGVLSTAYGNPAGITFANYGLYSRAIDRASQSFGIFCSSQTISPINYGIFASAPIGGTNFAGFFQGNLHVTGDITTNNGAFISSDQQFKTNIQDLVGASDLLNQLTPRTYFLDTVIYEDFNFESDQQMGLVAQEVEQILPTLVGNHTRPAQFDSLGVQIAPEISYKGVEYEELIPLLIAGFQEQSDRIDSLTIINSTVNTYNDSLEQVVSDLNARLTQLENCLSNILPALCNANSMAVQSTPEEAQKQLEKAINVTLSNRNNIVLNQNVPNPFAESTVITYSIPATVQKAQIHFYDGTGKLINSVEIAERGNGQLNVFANDLSTGVYTYSLVADGQIVATKRMMKQ